MKNVKLTMLAFAAIFVIGTTSVFASFPVKKEHRTEQTTQTNATTEVDGIESGDVQTLSAKEEIQTSANDVQSLDEKWILLLLWFFLGGFAAHRWYAKKPIGWNILYIITFGGCGIWAIVDLVNILTDNF